MNVTAALIEALETPAAVADGEGRLKAANAAFVALYRGSDVRQDLRSSDRVVAMGLFAAARIRPGEEIYVHYGTKSYANLRIGYTPGAAAVLSKEEIPRAELPAQVYGATYPADALWA